MYRVRPARDGDYEAFVRLFAELHLDDDAPDETRYLRELRERSWVVDGPEGTVAYAYFDVLGERAHIHQLVVAPEARRRGIARQLLRALGAGLARAGVGEWSLEVDPDNGPAVALYRSAGFEPRGASVGVSLAWRAAEPPPELRAQPLDPEHDAPVERAFDLAPGTLARLREHGVILVELLEAGEPAGVGGLLVDAACLHPFRVTRPELALSLLWAIRVVAEPEGESVRVLCDDAPAIASALVAAGGRVDYARTFLRGKTGNGA